MSFQTSERETYEAMWGFEQYASYAPGERYADAFLEMAGRKNPTRATVLDAGCGSGKGAIALQARGCDVRLCDLTDAGLVAEARDLPFREACLWQPLRPQLGALLAMGGSVDYVVCCDVLEHIPTPYTMLVIARLLEVARYGVFLSIALHPDELGAYVGKSLHQTVEGYTWWRDRLAELGTVRESRDLGGDGLYLVVPR